MKLGIKSRAFLKTAGLGSLVILAACSAIKLGYNNSASLAHTYITSKVDFESEQSAVLKTSLNEMVRWHRSKELPLLATELQETRKVLAAQNGVVQPINAAQVQSLYTAIRASLRRTADEAAPIIAKNILGLTAGQIPEIQTALEKSNKEYREKRFMPSQAERQEKSAERMVERFERWLGSLSSAQEKRIAAWAKTDNVQAETHYQKRVERQQQFMVLAQQAVNRQIDASALSREVAKLLNSWQTPANAQEKQDYEQRQRATIALVVDVLNVASVEQRNKAAERAAGWADDFQILASTR